VWARTRSIRFALIALVVGLGLAALVPGRSVGAPARVDAPDPLPQLQREGRWLVDQYGRVVIVHGVNLVWKRAPYAPPDTAAGFTAADAQWLQDHGFNGVRLGTLWAGITPDQPGVGDPAYRTRWQRVMDLLAQRGIWMQLDMHQDEWSETYGGEGVPAWAVKRPAPYNLFPPVQAPFPLGYWTPEVSTVFDRFWANKDRLRDGWADAWKVAAGWWRDQPYLMGYDLLNEPWMGMEWPACLTNGCPGAYKRELQPAMEQATRAVRSVDDHNVVWWEPQQLAAGQQVPTFLRPMAGEDQLGLSWHNYCFAVFLESQHVPGTNVNSCWRFSRERNRTALAQASRMHAVPLMSEWGATDNVPAIKIDAAVADENLMGWLHWAYKRWDDPTTADTAQGLFTDDADLSSVKQDKIRALVRTYAQATAGTPLAMSFDADTGAFSYRYRPDLSIAEPTVIFVSPLHYPDGYDVHVDGGTAVQRPDNLLWVQPDPGRTTPVSVEVTAR
jgi:endoglycosylceramidase